MDKVIGNNLSVHDALQYSAADLTASELASRSDWSWVRESEHFVQFYEADGYLLDSLGGFISAGLNEGEACIIVTTPAHQAGLEERLHAAGVAVAAAGAAGQYVALDASATLSQFMVDGQPEPERFAELIGGIIARAAAKWPRVRVFGEMVALLWAEGHHDAALRLEELWNRLHETHAFSLFCAYPMNGGGTEVLAAALNGVCAAHSCVIPAESYTALTEPDARLRAIIQLQQKARLLEAEILERREAEASLHLMKDELEAQVQDLRRARAEAESANRLKDEFLATVSHELRTPLHAIIGWAHLLRHKRLDEPTVTRAIQTIERNAKSQAQLVEDILDVSRVITGKLRLNIGPVDAAAVINAAVDSVQLAADSKGIQLEVMLEPSALHVAGDASRLQQVVWNLLSNAIKFTPAGGHVCVRLERAGTQVQIIVSDTGEGIYPDFLPFIFDRFRQADGTSTRRHGGLGLGLAIVRHLVELHGGTVHADSAGAGLGTTFSLRLPLAPERVDGRGTGYGSLSATEATDDGPPLPTLERVQVLIVDDDQDTLSMLAEMLKERGATVQAAASAAEALEVFRWFQPDVLVSDLAMPDEDGYSLISKVRALEGESGQPVPAVALTAYVRVEDRARALSAGFDMFVPKPVEPNELIVAIANLAEPDTASVEH